MPHSATVCPEGAWQFSILRSNTSEKCASRIWHRLCAEHSRVQPEDGTTLVFDAQWRRVFGARAGVDWDSEIDGEVDAWLSDRSACMRCNIRRALAVLIGRQTDEGASDRGRSDLLLELRRAGAIGRRTMRTQTPTR